MLLWPLVMVLWLASVQGVQVGSAFNIFPSFGTLGARVKVTGEPPFSSYTEVFQQVVETRSPFLAPDGEFNGDFLLQLCDNVNQLKAALFVDHEVEGVERPWRAYAGGWSRSMEAAHLGVNTSYLRTGAYGYALIRLTRHHEQVLLNPQYDLYFNSWTEEAASKVTPDQPGTVFEFIRNYGSHFVNSYTSGDMLYQVFVFSPEVYEEINKVMKEYEETGENLDQVLSNFSPIRAEAIGRIMARSGSPSVELWAAENLRTQATSFFFFPSLLKVHSVPELLQPLNLLLGNDAVLGMQLRLLTPYFHDKKKQMWFQEVLDNHLKLWELSA